jgi:hypothetical protein
MPLGRILISAIGPVVEILWKAVPLLLPPERKGVRRMRHAQGRGGGSVLWKFDALGQ